MFNPGILDDRSGLVPTAHSIDLYEQNMEVFLAKRRKWLWEKAIRISRFLVKWRYCPHGRRHGVGSPCKGCSKSKNPNHHEHKDKRQEFTLQTMGDGELAVDHDEDLPDQPTINM